MVQQMERFGVRSHVKMGKAKFYLIYQQNLKRFNPGFTKNRLS